MSKESPRRESNPHNGLCKSVPIQSGHGDSGVGGSSRYPLRNCTEGRCWRPASCFNRTGLIELHVELLGFLAISGGFVSGPVVLVAPLALFLRL